MAIKLCTQSCIPIEYFDNTKYAPLIKKDGIYGFPDWDKFKVEFLDGEEIQPKCTFDLGSLDYNEMPDFDYKAFHKYDISDILVHHSLDVDGGSFDSKFAKIANLISNHPNHTLVIEDFTKIRLGFWDDNNKRAVRELDNVDSICIKKDRPWSIEKCEISYYTVVDMSDRTDIREMHSDKFRFWQVMMLILPPNLEVIGDGVLTGVKTCIAPASLRYVGKNDAGLVCNPHSLTVSPEFALDTTGYTGHCIHTSPETLDIMLKAFSGTKVPQGRIKSFEALRYLYEK